MENDKIKEAIDFAEKIENASQFNVFWERPRREGFGVQLNFSGYNDLMLTIRDIMKVCVAALTEEDTASNLTISSVLEIALQLMPMEETMILDDCYALHQKLKQPNQNNHTKLS